MAGNNLLRLDVKVQSFFFDSAIVIRSIEPGKRKAMSKIGAFVRRTTRTMIGSVSKKAKPRPAGKPARVRTKKQPNIKSIQFSYDPQTESVVIGPIKRNQAIARDGYNPVDGSTIPQINEFGGRIRVTEIFRRGKWLPIKMFRRRSSRQLGPGEKKRTRVINYPRRPSIGPAFQQEQRNGKLIGAFKEIQGAGVIGPVAT